MEYQRCIELLATQDRAAGHYEDAALRSSYPYPTPEEWEACLREVSDGGEDVDNPYHCIGRYELRLAVRGIPTVLAAIAEELASITKKLPVPSDHLPDLLTLYGAIGEVIKAR